MMGNVLVVKLADVAADSAMDSPTLARWIEVSTIELSDGGKGTWIQAFPYKVYNHPLHGTLNFTFERALRFADNVKKHVRGQDLDIDYDHKELRGDAAGWIKDAEARPDGLYIFVEWTKEALTKLKEKAYRYFSPEFVDKWKHPETGMVHQDVLYGGALTNRPFLKGITPINLSEMVGSGSEEVLPNPEGGNQVDREKLEKLATNLKVEFTKETSDEDLLALITTASEQEPEPAQQEEENNEEEETPNPEAIAASEAQLVKLAETNPAVALLLSDRRRDRDRLARLEVANRLSEVTVKLSDIDNDKYQLAPKYRDKVRNLAVQLSEKGSDEFITLIKGIIKDGIVELGERGRNRPDNAPTELDEAGTLFDAMVKKLQESDKDLSFADAVERAAAQDPTLFEAYRSASYANDELRSN